MEHISELLNKIRLITVRENTLCKEKEKRGENFNIFSILKLSRVEVRLHSAFIVELLNPKGAHGLKDKFLRSFLTIVNSDIDFDFTSIHVESEFVIGQVNDNGDRGGRIDIIIMDKKNHAIIVENKIDAIDQPKQLLRYHNYAKEQKYQFLLLYLTKDGCTACDISTDKKNLDYACISYRKHILAWLEHCVELSSCYPLVRETLRQYIINIKNILYIMDTNNLNKLIEVATSDDYMEATLTILGNQREIQKRIRQKFIEQLKEVAERHDLMFKYDNEICDLKGDCWIHFHNPKVSANWSIFIGAYKHNHTNGVYYGITQMIYNKPHLTKQRLSELKPFHFWTEGEPSSDLPFGWSYLRGKDGIGDWWDWNNNNTLRDMANDTLAQYIENEIIIPVLKNKLLQKIEKLSSK
ncbi:PD-(D/E)XK nuclease family protein [Bacteroides sp. GM023]|uniref:PDDEXK-like family protein n=1 Tax=Bacteroides sp. GM023 TaxID=2723058 RepID=UPI00168B2BB1|nr:PD-(D/E)XK nuclease family protein [Bacteroides sp. GM023]MBD3591514.1 PD-(D/E)XK nuclease family protein [Bacteroides sp. GM023]